MVKKKKKNHTQMQYILRLAQKPLSIFSQIRINISTKTGIVGRYNTFYF